MYNIYTNLYKARRKRAVRFSSVTSNTAGLGRIFTRVPSETCAGTLQTDNTVGPDK